MIILQFSHQGKLLITVQRICIECLLAKKACKTKTLKLKQPQIEVTEKHKDSAAVKVNVIVYSWPTFGQISSTPVFCWESRRPQGDFHSFYGNFI